MNEEFKFQPSGTRRLMTFAELDAAVHKLLKDDVDALEERIIRVGENQRVEIFDRRLETRQDTMSIGTMRASDILLKFK